MRAPAFTRSSRTCCKPTGPRITPAPSVCRRPKCWSIPPNASCRGTSSTSSQVGPVPLTQAEYQQLVDQRRFARDFLPHAQIVRKKHLINCIDLHMPLLLVEDFHAAQPPVQRLPREVIRHNSLHRHATLDFSLGDHTVNSGGAKTLGQSAGPLGCDLLRGHSRTDRHILGLTGRQHPQNHRRRSGTALTRQQAQVQPCPQPKVETQNERLEGPPPPAGRLCPKGVVLTESHCQAIVPVQPSRL